MIRCDCGGSTCHTYLRNQPARSPEKASLPWSARDSPFPKDSRLPKVATALKETKRLWGVVRLRGVAAALFEKSPKVVSRDHCKEKAANWVGSFCPAKKSQNEAAKCRAQVNLSASHSALSFFLRTSGSVMPVFMIPTDLRAGQSWVVEINRTGFRICPLYITPHHKETQFTAQRVHVYHLGDLYICCAWALGIVRGRFPYKSFARCFFFFGHRRLEGEGTG